MFLKLNAVNHNDENEEEIRTIRKSISCVNETLLLRAATKERKGKDVMMVYAAGDRGN